MNPTNLLSYIYTTAAKHPDKPAFISETSAFTFSELKSKTEIIGSFIADKNIYNEPVLIFMEKSPEEISALLGVICSGNYYVALDLEMTYTRLSHIIDITESKLMICDKHTETKAESLGFKGKIYNYDEIITGKIVHEALLNIYQKTKDTDPVYIVFTSGSTGVPKGVVASHRNVIDYIEGLGEVLECDENTIFGNQAPLYLDASLKDIYTTLKYGATTYFIPKKLFMSPVKLIEYLNKHKINTVCFVASALTIFTKLSAFEYAKPKYLRVIAFGGEVFPLSHLKQWMKACPKAKFINLYGATESTGMSSYYVVDDVERLENSIPIGKPLPDTEIFLIDEEGNPIVKLLPDTEISAIDEEGNPTVKQSADMEIFQHDEKDLATEEPLPDTKISQIVDEGKTVGKGLRGEICIGGTGLALGYYKDVEKTKEKFVENPLNEGISKLIYKTGDIGYYGEDGEIYFAGRKDNQIKHRGYRIELEEIEACGNEISGVERGVCHYDNDKEIIIFFYEGSIETDKVKEYFRNKLAGYMVPGKIVKLAKLPNMAGGKIDRKALAILLHSQDRKPFILPNYAE